MTHAPSQMPELKPCPFCAVQPKLEIEADDDGYEYGGAWSYASISAVHEKTCPLYQSQELGDNSGSIQIVDFSNENLERFINAWNTRAASVPSDKERAEALTIGERIELMRHRRRALTAPDLSALEAEWRDIAYRGLCEIREIYCNMEGFIPQTAPEGYVLQEIKRMYDTAVEHIKLSELTPPTPPQESVDLEALVTDVCMMIPTPYKAHTPSFIQQMQEREDVVRWIAATHNISKKGG